MGQKREPTNPRENCFPSFSSCLHSAVPVKLNSGRTVDLESIASTFKNYQSKPNQAKGNNKPNRRKQNSNSTKISPITLRRPSIASLDATVEETLILILSVRAGPKPRARNSVHASLVAGATLEPSPLPPRVY